MKAVAFIAALVLTTVAAMYAAAERGPAFPVVQTCPPPAEDQYRVVFQTRGPDGALQSLCYVDQLDGNIGITTMLRRLIKKELAKS